VKLDGFIFSDKDKEVQLNKDKVLGIPLIMECSKDQWKDIESDTMDTSPQHDIESSPSKPSRNIDWEEQIEHLNLQHQQISVINNLDLFINIRKLNLMDNNITRISGLD